MIKHNRSKLEVRSSYQGYMVPPHAWSEDPSMQSRRRCPSISSNTKLNANKYSISNSIANHTIINDNYNYNVYKYTIYDDSCASIHNGQDNNRKIDEDHKGLYGSYIYDNDNYSIYVNGKYNENYGREIREGKCPERSERKESIDEDFTFSIAADSLEFFNFNSSACTTDRAEACGRPSMSPADELFQDGKIRPLIQPIINGYDHPMNPLLDQHASSFNEFAAHYLASSANQHCVTKQDFHTENLDHSQDFLHQREPDHHGLSSRKSLAHQEELDHGFDSAGINQKSLHQGALDHGLSCNDQIEFEPNYGGLPLQILSVSAPSSPVKEILPNHERNDNHGSPQIYSVVSTSQVNCYKRCRSLSRVFQMEDNEQILEVQDLVEDGTKGSGFVHYKKKTLQDFLTQEEEPMSKPEMIKEEPYKIIKEKKLGLIASPNRNAKKFLYDAERRPSLAPAPINIPHLWPVREKLSAAAPPTNGKSSKAPCPHELHYGSQKAQADRLKKKTFLPYRPGLLGCLGYPPH